MWFGKRKLGLMGSLILFISSMMFIFGGTILFVVNDTVKKEIYESNIKAMQVLGDSAYGYIESLHKGVENGEYASVAEAQNIARKTLAGEKIENNRRDISTSEFKIGEDGYIWAWSDNYMGAMHPMGHEGVNGKNFVDANGQYVIQDFVKISKEEDPKKRFYKYTWRNHPDEEARPKVAYSRHFEPWGWNVGIGLYEDEIFAGIHSFNNTLIFLVLFNTIIAVLLVYFIFKNYQKN